MERDEPADATGWIGAVLFAFGRFNFLGWHGDARRRPAMLPHRPTASQRAMLKYFIVVSLLFLAGLFGGGVAHFRADAASFYGIDISRVFPSQLLRTWHLQLAILWIATAFLRGRPVYRAVTRWARTRLSVVRRQSVVCRADCRCDGSLLGEWLGIRQMLGQLWEWFGDQGWEYLDLGKAWQIGLAAGLVIWVVLLFRALRPSFSDPSAANSRCFFSSPVSRSRSSTSPPFSIVARPISRSLTIGASGSSTCGSRTSSNSLSPCRRGTVLPPRRCKRSHRQARHLSGCDSLLVGGVLGTAHHWYFTGQSSTTMAIGATVSALEVVPLVLLTLDAWDFIRASEGDVDSAGKRVTIPHQWTFYFLMAVGFWNFLGAGVFGFLINMPIVSYFEVGTVLTPNHAHASFMGVFGFLGVALLVFTCREVVEEDNWARLEKWVRVSFWGLNLGLASMIIFNLFPGGVMQLYDVLQNGYWHARGHEYLASTAARFVEWARLPGDMVFIFAGVAPLLWITIERIPVDAPHARRPVNQRLRTPSAGRDKRSGLIPAKLMFIQPQTSLLRIYVRIFRQVR